MSSYFEGARPDIRKLLRPEDQRVLDVGCAAGGFLSSITDSVDRCEGIEADPSAAAAARNLGLAVQTGYFPGTRPTHEDFDLITFNDVLEHMVDPWGALREAVALLKPGGGVIVCVPNIRNLATIVDLVVGGNWNYVDAGVLDRTHLRFFTRSSLVHMIEAAGLQIESITGSWPLTTKKMKVLRLMCFLGGKSLYQDAVYRQWIVRARLTGEE